MTNFEKLILTAVGALFVIVLLVGAIVLRQQKDITALKAGTVSTNPNQPNVKSPTKKISFPLPEVIKQFPGAIESISGNQMIISVNLPDFSKPKDPEKFKNAASSTNITGDDFEAIVKKMTVNTNEKTVFNKKPLAELKAGDTVFVTSDKSPYMADAVTAEKITYIELLK